MGYEIIIKPNAFTEKVFLIDEKTVAYHDLEMECKDITGFRYGATSTRVHGVETGVHYVIQYIDSSGDEMNVSFGESLFNINEAQTHFNAIVQLTWKFVGNRLLNEYVSAVSQGTEVEIGETLLTQQGVTIKKKPLFGKEKTYTIAWHHIRAEMSQGILDFKSAVDSDVYKRLSVQHNYNMHILYEIFNLARTNRQTLEYLTGKQKYEYIS